MAEVAGVTAEEYEEFAAGTTIFSADDAAAAFEDGDDTTSLLYTAELINPFLVEHALSPELTDLTVDLRPQLHPGLPGAERVTVVEAVVPDRDGRRVRRSRPRRAPGVAAGQPSASSAATSPPGPRWRWRAPAPAPCSSPGTSWPSSQSGGAEAIIPTPATTWSALVDLARSGDLLDALAPSARRVAIGYSMSLVVGIVVGLLVGCFRAAEAFFEPTIGFLRYIPATGLTVLFVLWLGIDEGPKVGLVVAGTVFYNIIMIADVARSLPMEQVNAAYTLGAGRLTVLRRVVLPHSYPGIIDVARVNLAAAWLMLVVGELQGGQEGLAIELTKAGRFRQYDRIWAILIVFGAIGLLSDVGLRWLRRRTAPWSEGSR